MRCLHESDEGPRCGLQDGKEEDLNRRVHGTTMVISAAQLGHHTCLSALIEAGADVNKRGKILGSTTALYEATSKGHIECVKLLLEAGADVNRKYCDQTPLVSAAEAGHLECLQLLLQARSKYKDNKKVEEAEQVLIQNPEVDVVQESAQSLELDELDKTGGEDDDAGDDNAESYENDLDTLSKGSENIDEEGESEKEKSDSDQSRRSDNSFSNSDNDKSDKDTTEEETNSDDEWVSKETAALIVAAHEDNCKCVELLIKAGADVNEENGGNTALLCAAEKGCEHCVNALIDAGADVNLTCEPFAGDYRFEIPVSPLCGAGIEGHLNIVQLLLKSGAVPDDYALIETAAYGNTRCVSALIAAGVDLNAVGDHKETALIRAAYGGNFACVKTLIAAGADVNVACGTDTQYSNARNFGGETALHMAAHFFAHSYDLPCTENASMADRVRCIKLLLKAGARVTIFNIRQRNPLQHKLCETSASELLETDNHEMVMLLFAAGCEVGEYTENLPEYLQKHIEMNLCLKDVCRRVVRKQLINIHLRSRNLTVSHGILENTTEKVKSENIEEFTKDKDEESNNGLSTKDVNHKTRISEGDVTATENLKQSISHDGNLFHIVGLLGLPQIVSEYLLYDLSLKDE